MAEKASYGNIFKTTALFSFVQIVHIVSKVVVNKVAALVLGAEGLGIISLYNSAISLLKSGCGLGIKQSAVRDVAEANKINDSKKISEIISITNKVVIVTTFLGLFVTIISAPLFCKFSFGDAKYLIPFIILSVAVALNIYAEGQMAILTGMRKLRELAKANILGSIVGLVASIPCYVFFGKDGIVPSLIISALSLFVATKVYVYRIHVDQIRVSMSQAIQQSKPMVKMGFALMIAGFLGLAFDLLVSSFIRYEGGLDTVGLYQAGATIITGYFGVILTAMTTDYYPRICSINRDDVLVGEELNKQVSAGLLMIFPLAVCFIFLAPVFITFLYTAEFLGVTTYIDFAIFGMIIVVASNCMGMVFMAKMESKLYLRLVVSIQLILLPIYMLLYHFCGLKGLGVSYMLNGVISFLIYGIVLFKKYRIKINLSSLSLMSIIFGSLLVTILIRNYTGSVICIILGSVICVGAFYYSYYYLKHKIGVDVVQLGVNFFKKKTK